MRRYDGVICFGGTDWWYHNRGHYELQMMRELSASVPVLYVNSIGMRVPSVTEGGVFLHRVARKLRSLRRGMVRVDDGFAVFSPLSVPGARGAVLTRKILAPQVRLMAGRLGIRRPLVWVACPPAVEALDGLSPTQVVYQRTDRSEAYTGVDRELIRGYDRRLKQQADLTLFCSTLLYEEEAAQCRSAAFVDHGVDYADFAAAAGEGAAEPPDVASLPRPRVGFIGGIDGHTFDPGLFVETARRLPDIQFVLVGTCTLPEGWCQLPNVALLGQRPYDHVASYMAACDVLIMPWNRSPWIEACNPVKLKEYLAVGRPVVSTPFRELERYPGLVRTAEGAEDFAAEIRAALGEPGDAPARRDRVRSETWGAKAAQVLASLSPEEGGDEASSPETHLAPSAPGRPT